MYSAHTITLAQLALFYTLLSLSFALLWLLNMKSMMRDLLLSVLRMSVQLSLIAVYLQFLFALNNVWVNGFWLLIMVGFAGINIAKCAQLSIRRMFPVITFSLLAAMGFVLCAMVILVKPDPWYDARYLIPLMGVILGNAFTANILVLERFYSLIGTQRDRYMADLLMGETLIEAMLPLVRESLKVGLNPMIATLATIGIVFLPGMMTGQTLGGADPVAAVMYQALIMAGIAISTLMSSLFSLFLSARVSFDGYGLLKSGIILNKR